MNTTLTSDACAAICKHMNEDHAEANAALVCVYGGVAGVRSAQMVALDEMAMEFSAETAAGQVVARIDFDHVLCDSNDARETLIAMARKALSGT